MHSSRVISSSCIVVIIIHRRHLRGLFGNYFTEKLKSQLFPSYHHVVYGKYARGRGRKPRHRTCQLLCRAITGETRIVEVGEKSTVGDMQKPVCDLFGKECPATTVFLS